MLALACAVTIALAQDEPAPEPKPQPAPKELTQAEKDALATRAYFVLRNRCWGCHGEPGKTAYGETVALDWILDYDKLVEAKLVIPGKVKESRLIYLTTLGRMPREFDENGKPSKEGELPEAEQKALVEWVKAGAPKWTEMKFTHEWVQLPGPALEYEYDPNLHRQVVDHAVVQGKSVALVRESSRQPKETIRVLVQSPDGWKQVGTEYSLFAADDAWLLPGDAPTLIRQTARDILRETVTTLVDEWNGEDWVSLAPSEGLRPQRPGSLARTGPRTVRMLAWPVADDEKASLWELDTIDSSWKQVHASVPDHARARLVTGPDGSCRSVDGLGIVFEYDKTGKRTALCEKPASFMIEDCWQGHKSGGIVARAISIDANDALQFGLVRLADAKWEVLPVAPLADDDWGEPAWDAAGQRIVTLARTGVGSMRWETWALIPWRKAK